MARRGERWEAQIEMATRREEEDEGSAQPRNKGRERERVKGRWICWAILANKRLVPNWFSTTTTHNTMFAWPL